MKNLYILQLLDSNEWKNTHESQEEERKNIITMKKCKLDTGTQAITKSPARRA